jgi:hypothetical protein
MLAIAERPEVNDDPKTLLGAVRIRVRGYVGKFTFKDHVRPLVKELFYKTKHNCKNLDSALAEVRCTLQRMREQEGLNFINNKGVYRWPSSVALRSPKTQEDVDLIDSLGLGGQDINPTQGGTTVLDNTNDPVFRALREIEASPGKRQLPNLQRPIIEFVRADRFVLDLSENRQRDPVLREKKLKKQFGENGELFDFEKFELVTALPRDDGSLWPSAGMGRIWSVINLLKRPDLEIPVLIKREKGDQKEKRAFVHSVTNAVPINKASLFMTLGNLTGKEYEVPRAIVQELTRLGLTTVPGAGANSVTLTAAIFAGRLGVLSDAYRLCRKWWFADTVKRTGNYKRQVEGIALTAVSALLYTFDDVLDYDRLDSKFEGKDFDAIKKDATSAYSPGAKPEGRELSQIIAKWMCRKYNGNPPKTGRFTSLDFSQTLQIRDDFDKDSPLYKDMHDTWRMHDKSDD